MEENADVDLHDSEDVTADVRRLESNNFGGASDGLEAADMLNQFKPGLYESSGNENEEQAKAGDGSISDAFGGHKLPIHHHTSSHHTHDDTTRHSAPDDHSNQDEPNYLIRKINEATGDDSPIIHARLEPASSQMLDLVAEGMDAADAIFDPIAEGESEEMNNEMDSAGPRSSPEIVEPLKKATGSILAADAAREILGQKTDAARERSVSDKPDDDTDIDDDDNGERPPRKWLEFFNEFHGEGAAKLKGKLIRRDRAFHQTSNKMNISCTVEEGDFESRCGYWLILISDWYDTFLKYGTSYIIFILFLIYTVTILVFAGFYYAIAQNCGTSESMTYSQAFAFSLETATTIGYTLPQSNNAMFFEGCPSWVVVIFLQCMYYLIFNGVVIGTLMLRYSRADRRSNQIIFSKSACIVCIRGRFYFTFQCFDLQASQPIIGATVRIFALLHEVDKEAKALWQVRAMRLIRPDDEIGGKLWLSVPSICIHEIDAWSALAPSILTRPPRQGQSTAANRFPQPPQRSSDGRVGSRAQATCAVCGGAFLTEASLRRHILYSQQDERSRGRPDTFGHLKLNVRNFSRPVVNRVDSSEGNEPEPRNLPYPIVEPEVLRDAIKARIESRNIEIVCIIEGTDPHTANSFQARHSYGPPDIEYDAQHAPCMGIGQDGCAEVNLSYFHNVIHHEHVNVEEPIAFASHT